jgi:hypothetical protein
MRTELQFCEMFELPILEGVECLQLLIVCVGAEVLMMIWVRRPCCCARNL